MTSTQQRSVILSEDEALHDLLSWSEKNCPKWQQQALSCLCSGRELDENNLSELANLSKGSGQGYVVPTTASHQAPRKFSKTVKITGIHDVENVNALQSERPLTFCKEGVTVVYGDNGSGKSGYVRILKSACHSRTPTNAVEILPDIRKDNTAEQKCLIKYSVSDENKKKHWTAEDPNDEFLRKVSVFDSQTANVHADEANNVAYMPFPLLVLERLADACRKVKGLIQEEIYVLKNQTPNTISNPTCGKDSAVGELLAGLSGKTSDEKVKALATLSEEDKKRQKELEADLSDDPLNTAKKLEETARQLNEANQTFETLQNATSDAKIAELSELQSSYSTARETAQIAATNLFKDCPLPHVGSEVWKKLWDAAREYSEQQAYPNLPFPVAAADKHCVLCQQELDDKAVARMQSFADFVKDKTKSEEERSRKAYRDALDYIKKSDVPRKDIAAVVTLLRDEDQKLAELARISAIKNKWRLRSVLRSYHQEHKEQKITSASSWPSEKISQYVKNLQERIKGLQAKENSAERKQMHSRLAELKAREWLATVQEDVIAEIERRKKREKLENVVKDTDTHKITRKSSELAERLVTDALCRRFHSEVSKFDATGLEVELRKEKSTLGTPLFRIFLAHNQHKKVSTKDVLSEGEHRCVAIAAFLAELATSASNSAIVFDDPVSSLDHTYKDKVARRLAQEGKHRQVIVFTHDIVFLLSLDKECSKQSRTKFACRAVARTSSNAGVVQQDPPLRAQKIEKAMNSIQNQLDKEKILYEQGMQDKWESAVASLLKRLRKTCERAVEDIIEPVLKRMSNKVEIAGLVELTVLKKEDCRVMCDTYQRLSELLHSSADAENKPTPTPELIQKELNELRKWFDDLKARQCKVKKLTT